jgi:hypothetical protein
MACQYLYASRLGAGRCSAIAKHGEIDLAVFVEVADSDCDWRFAYWEGIRLFKASVALGQQN